MLKDLGFFLLLLAVANAGDNVTWFIGGPNHPNASANATCGRTAQLPCTNLSAVLEVFKNNDTGCTTNYNQGNWSSTTVIFLDGTHVIPTLCLHRWSNVTIRSEGNASIVSDNTGDAREDHGIFTFVNCSNIKVVNLYFNVTVAERVALLFENSSDVLVLNCTYYLPARNSKGININQPQGSVVIQGCIFKGGLLNEETTESRGLHIVYDKGISTTRIENCYFKEFFNSTQMAMAKQKNLHRAHKIGQALILYFNVASIGHNVSVSRCRFMENFVHSGSTFLIVFDSTSQLNSIHISKCQLIANVNLYGAVGVHYWRQTHGNNVSIRDSIFSDNSAILEGGGIFAIFLSQSVSNFLEVDNCMFKNNTATKGAAIHLFNSPMWFTHEVDIRDKLVSVNISNCLFTNNTALIDKSNVASGTEGIINALRIKLFLSKTKYVIIALSLYLMLLWFLDSP